MPKSAGPQRPLFRCSATISRHPCGTSGGSLPGRSRGPCRTERSHRPPGVVHGPVDGLHPVPDPPCRGVAAVKARQDIGDDGRGSSVRGLSEVTTAKSASSAATLPMRGRLVRSRSPPQPNTATVRPLGKTLHRLQTILHAVRRVGVVDEDGIVLSGGGDHLHRALHMGGLGQNSSALSGKCPAPGAPPAHPAYYTP